MAHSVPIAICGVEKPRIAPAGGLFVYQRKPRARTWGTTYGPLAWIKARVMTVGPHEA